MTPTSETEYQARIRKVVAAAPPLTGEQGTTLAAMLPPPEPARTDAPFRAPQQRRAA